MVGQQLGCAQQVVVQQESQQPRFLRPRRRLKSPPRQLSQQLSQQALQSLQHVPQPAAGAAAAGAGFAAGAGAAAGACPASQADVTNRNAAFTRDPPYGLDFREG